MIRIRSGAELARVFFATTSQSLTIAAAFSAAACATAPASLTPSADFSASRYLMGTRCDLTLHGNAADAAAAFDEIDRIEQFLSTWKNESELSRFNRAPVGEKVVLSPELASLLGDAMRISRETGGAFNPLIRPLIEVWRTRDEGSVPSQQSIASALSQLDLARLKIDADRSRAARLGEVRFEEGGFGKGYALDRAVAILRARKVASAVFDFGGQIAVYGREIAADVADPRERHIPALSVSLRDASLSTSSGSEKQFEIDGVRFSHLIDPRSGNALPPRGSVSVIHESALTADALSTALYVMGPDEGMQFANEQKLRAIFIIPSPESAERYDVLVSDALAADQHVRSLDPVKYNLRKNS